MGLVLTLTLTQTR